jgi:nucleotide-binding universal stress UspA family protein
MKVREVLLATDFSAASEAAGQAARDLARQSGGTLHLVHVVRPVTAPGDAAEQLTRLATALGEGVAVRTALLSGHTAREIIAFARDKRVDLIVLGTHGRTGVSRAILGSVAENVVRLAPCPVLTVPSGASVPDAPAEAVEAVEATVRRRCVVCGRESEELICEPCRTRIRGEALERKLEAERPGRRGSPA